MTGDPAGQHTVRAAQPTDRCLPDWWHARAERLERDQGFPGVFVQFADLRGDRLSPREHVHRSFPRRTVFSR